VLRWLPSYERSSLTPDVIAGLTVWALLVPEALAYAAIAGVPAQYGLYAVPLALVGYVAFGTSRELFVGPSASVATMSATAVGAVAVSGTPASSYIALTAALSLVVGAMYVVLGIAKAGFIARFFATPVLAGFIIGLGIFIAVGQLPKLVGIEKPAGNTIAIFFETLGHVADWQWTTVLVGTVALAALFVIARRLPKVPGALLMVALSILAVKALGLGAHGVALVGDVPTGFEFVSWSSVSLHDLYELLPGAFAIVVVGYAQSVAIAKEYAARKHYAIDPNQELVAYGAANIGAGVLQGLTVTGSLSKSAAAEQAGGRTPMLLIVTAALVVLTTLVLAGAFADLPEAVLAAIVIQAVWGMMNPGPLVRLRRARFGEFWLGLGALLGVIVVDIPVGVVVGVTLSFVLLIHRLGHPNVAVLGRPRSGVAYGDIDRDDDCEAVPGLLILRFEAPLVFANADIFTDELRSRVEAASPRPRAVILDCEAIADVDTTGDDALRGLHEHLATHEIGLLLARVNDNVREFMRRDGVLARIGDDNVFPRIQDAVAAAAGRAVVTKA